MANDNRIIPRIDKECPMTYAKIDSPNRFDATALNFSNNGIQFLTNEKIDEGTLWDVILTPENNAAKTINAIIQVVRVDFSYGKFKVAGIIKTFK